ncbi:MAG: GxxExxY protein, partial [Pyramidobacter sp.]|nr:GxxExxY protein [Pyramidobacter sp.]
MVTGGAHLDKAYVENLGRQIVDSAYSVHTALGPGLFENVYGLCLVRELELRSIPC